MYYTYILKSEKDNSHYYGHTKDLQFRLKENNNGKVRYTKWHRPYKIWYYEKYKTKLEAQKRELYFKSIEGYNWLRENGII